MFTSRKPKRDTEAQVSNRSQITNQYAKEAGSRFKYQELGLAAKEVESAVQSTVEECG
jgi:hypothetical protein